jgi:DNA-binding beta-propeller fold protein YncE
MRVRPYLQHGLLAIAMLGVLSLSVFAQSTSTPEPAWGAKATEEASWDAMDAAATAESSWDTIEATTTAESSWDTMDANAAADSSWDAAAAPLTLVWQSAFTSETALFSPGDIAIDKDGNVYVSTQSANTVKKFDWQGNQVLEWGGNGSDDGEFSLSLGIGVDSESNVYVTDFYNRRIQKFDSEGTFLLQWPNEPSKSPAFLAVDTQGNVYVDQFPPRGEDYVHKFDGWGMLLSKWGNDNKQFGGQIEDIAVDKDGNLYVADFVAHRIQKFSPDGELLASFGGELSKEGNGRFENPFGIAVDNEGYMYVLDKYFLQKLDWEGNCVAQWSTAGGELDQASNVAVDGDGNIYVFAHTDVKAANGNTVNVPLLKKFSQAE